MLNGLSVINLELTSRCSKSCWMCGRRKLEKEHPELCSFGDMSIEMALNIIKQIPNGIIVQLHSNGEPLLYPYLNEVLYNLRGKIRCFNTNAIDLIEKADEIIDELETLTISVIENDELGDKQYEDVVKFLEIKGDRKPNMIYRLLGNVDKAERWYQLPGIIATRMLHKPMGSFGYTKKVTIPEVGFCTDLYGHLVIDRTGDIFPCVRFDYNKINKLGNIKEMSLEEAWNSEKRLYLLSEHIKGNRNCSELCSKCEYYGIPRGD